MSGFAFVIRDTSRMEVVREPASVMATVPGTAGPVSDDAMRNVMDLVGSAPLKDIVRGTRPTWWGEDVHRNAVKN